MKLQNNFSQVMVCFLHVVLTFIVTSCSVISRTEAPLKNDMTLTYEVTTTIPDRTKRKTITLKFVKIAENSFELATTVSEMLGSHLLESELEKESVDGYFIYDKVMNVLVDAFPVWKDPAKLSSGNLGIVKVVEEKYGGRDVYALQRHNGKTYYDKETGILLGAEERVDDITLTVKRIS